MTMLPPDWEYEYNGLRNDPMASYRHAYNHRRPPDTEPRPVPRYPYDGVIYIRDRPDGQRVWFSAPPGGDEWDLDVVLDILKHAKQRRTVFDSQGNAESHTP